jgi:hypothetical protein
VTHIDVSFFHETATEAHSHAPSSSIRRPMTARHPQSTSANEASRSDRFNQALHADAYSVGGQGVCHALLRCRRR